MTITRILKPQLPYALRLSRSSDADGDGQDPLAFSHGRPSHEVDNSDETIFDEASESCFGLNCYIGYLTDTGRHVATYDDCHGCCEFSNVPCRELSTSVLKRWRPTWAFRWCAMHVLPPVDFVPRPNMRLLGHRILYPFLSAEPPHWLLRQ